jgi:hypothetical protein
VRARSGSGRRSGRRTEIVRLRAPYRVLAPITSAESTLGRKGVQGRGSAAYPPVSSSLHARRLVAVIIRWVGWAFSVRRNPYRGPGQQLAAGNRSADLDWLGDGVQRWQASICPQNFGNVSFHLSPKFLPKSMCPQSICHQENLPPENWPEKLGHF